MSDFSSDSSTPVTLKVSYPSREVFLEDFDRHLSRGQTAVEVDRPLEPGEKVELLVTFPGLREPLRLRGAVSSAGEPGPVVRLNIELLVRSSGWARVTQQVEQIRRGDPALTSTLLRVLLVEDNPHVARLIRDGLEAYVRRSGHVVDFLVSHAANGQEALDQLSGEHWHLLLADVYLPILDGERLIRTVRADPRHAALPIIAFSAGGGEARDRALGAGADLFLEKPVRLAELLESLHEVLSRRLGGEGAGRESRPT